jgi:hypothetical protein
MPIRSFLNGQTFDAETTRIMGVAFEITCTAIRLADRDPAEAIIAQRIIEFASAGERNPDVLCERVLFELGKPEFTALPNKPAEYHRFGNRPFARRIYLPGGSPRLRAGGSHAGLANLPR